MKYLAIFNYYQDIKYNNLAKIAVVMKGFDDREAAHPEQPHGRGGRSLQ